MESEEPRKLRGHKSTATCCIASRDRPGVLVTSGEDACVCWFDLRCKDVQFIIDVGTEPVSSLCFKTGNENILYASSGNEIKSFDVQTVINKKNQNFTNDPLVIINAAKRQLSLTNGGTDLARST